MSFRSIRRLALALGGLTLGSAPAALAQAPPVPVPAVPPPAATAAPSAREAELEARVRQLEAMVQQLSGQVSRMTPPAATGGATAPQPDAGAGTPLSSGGALSPGGAAPGRGSGTPGAGTATPDVGNAATATAPSAGGGAAAPGQSLPPNPPPSARFDSPATLDSIRANAKFGPGFEIRSIDDEYILQFHNLTQFDYRGYQQGGQTPVHDTFAFPRQWFMFSGRLTKPFGYFVSLQNGFDTVSLLDVFLDIDYDPRLRLRIGRYKTPFTYEFFVEPIQGLVVPERSIFFNNFGQNRDLGIMAFGRLLDNKLDYAAGIFNATRNSFLAVQDEKAISAFMNYRPWGDEENTLLENFNVGGSVFATSFQQPPIPQTFRTVVATSGNTTIGVPFFQFNNNVRESGPAALWDLHLAYFYKQLAVIGEWGSGYQDYALASNLRARTHLPIQSYYIQASYLLTGETRSSIGIVKPLRPFDIRKGKCGPGAIEPFFRYEYLDYSNEVFTRGLADPNLWANRAFQTWVGVNWHLTQYIKMYFGWNHSEFNQPVLFAPNRRQLTSDLFLVRFQVYF
jgi:phosphate-selective porin OprO and OprP